MSAITNYLQALSPTYTARKRREAEWEREDQQRAKLAGQADTFFGVQGGQNQFTDAISSGEFDALPPEMQAEFATKPTGLLGREDLTPAQRIDAEQRKSFLLSEDPLAQKLTLERAMNRQQQDQAARLRGVPTGSDYANPVMDANGNRWATNKRTNRFEQMPGNAMEMPVKSPMVNIAMNNNKPKAPIGMQTIQDPTGEWAYKPVKGGEYDKKSDLYRENRSKLYRKAVSPFRNALNSLTNFQGVLKETGIQPSPHTKEGKKLAQAQTSALMDLKNVFGLGVLSKDDERLINAVLPTGTSIVDYALTSSKDINALVERSRQDILKRGLEVRTEYPNANYGDDLFKPIKYETRIGPDGRMQRRRIEYETRMGPNGRMQRRRID